MALVVKDRVKVTTTTTGTGTLTLGSAATKFQDFSVIGDGNTTYYAIESGNGTDWEIGVGTYTASGTTLSRDTILESSNAGSAINLSGTSTVFCTYPAERSVNTADIGTTIQAYDADTAKYDDTTANFTGTLQNGGSNVVVDTDIGSTVQAYDADTAKYDDATANFTGNLQKSGANVLTSNQTITLSGDATGSGTTAITVTVTDNSHSHTSANISDATSANTANTIVERDGSGNFSAGTITASLSGNASTVTDGVYTTGSYANPSWITSLDDGKVLPSMTGNSGKYLTTDGTNSSWAAVASSLAGEIKAIASNLSGSYSIPSTGTVDANGFMYCDGSAIPGGRTLSGNVPNLTDGRFLRGSTSSGTASGSETFTLAEANLPSHTHTGTTSSAGGHNHIGGTKRVHDAADGQYGQTTPGSVYLPVARYGGTTNYDLDYTSTVGDHSHTFTTSATGSGTAVTHIPKYVNVQYIIKVD